MATEDIPQFVTITFDDGLTAEKFATYKKYVLDVVDSRRVPTTYHTFHLV